MLRLLPHDEFTLASPHPVKALVERLDAVTEPDRPLFLSQSGPWFHGHADASGFQLIRVIPGRNGFAPRIEGEFGPDDDETHVHVELSLPSLVTAFLLFWISFVVLIGGAFSYNGLTNEAPIDNAFAILPALMIAFVWMMSGLFWLEARRTKAELMHVFEAHEVQQPASPRRR